MNERLYELLPLIYRELDFRQGQPLRGLMAVLQNAHDVISDDIERMYRNWFVETCDADRIPFIADLVGMDEMDIELLLPRERRYVANHLAYGRRKGTSNTIRNVINDSSAFACLSVSEGEHIFTTWSTRDPQLQTRTFSNTVDHGAFADTPFDPAGRTADFRSGAPSLLNAPGGRLNLRTVSIYLWRMSARPVYKAGLTADEHHPLCYHISPFRRPVRLSNITYQLYDKDKALTFRDYPIAITRNNYHQLMSSERCDRDPPLRFYELNQDTGKVMPMETSAVELADLTAWKSVGGSSARLLIDPDLARIYLRDESLAGRLLVSYAPLGMHILGAGSARRCLYHKGAPIVRIGREQPDKTLTEAVQAWKHVPAIISLEDNTHYSDPAVPAIALDKSEFTLAAGENCVPVVSTDLVLHNTTPDPIHVVLSGLIITGQIKIVGPVHLDIEHCTLVDSDRPSIATDKTAMLRSIVNIKNSLMCADHLPDALRISVIDSVLQLRSQMYVESLLCLSRTTVMGSLNCLAALDIVDSLITGDLRVKKSNDSSVLYSYVGALKIDQSGNVDHVICPDSKTAGMIQFCSTRFTDGNFGLLSEATDKEVLQGASNGDEVGAFNSLRLRLREQKIVNRMKQYLPVGLEPATIYVD